LRIVLILFAFLFLQVKAYSQDSSGFKHSRFVFSNVILHGGFYFQGEYNFMPAEYQKLAPESELLENDFSEYYREKYDGCRHCIFPDAGWSLGAQAAFKFYNKKRKKYSNTEIRTGIFYSWQNNSAVDLGKNTWVRYDSIETGNSTTYYDSVWSNRYSFLHEWQQINADFSILFRINPRSYVSFATGFGMTAGLAFSRRTQIDFASWVDTLSSTSNYIPNDSSFVNYGGEVDYSSLRTQSFRHDPAANFIFYVPIEMDIYMHTQNHPVINRFYFLVQCRPGLHLLSMPKGDYTVGFMVPVHAGIGCFF